MQKPDQDVYPEGVELRDWEDFPKLRQNIFDSVKKSVTESFPQSYGGVRLELHDVDYDNDKEVPLSEQKEALMTNKYLARRLVGTYRLFDEKTGDMLDEKKSTVMRVPYLTDRGTTIHNGSEYTTMSQARLLPGAYTRRKESGELETHFNAKRGSGNSFRIRLEPETGLFKMDIGQSSLRLYSLLKDIGVPDEQLEKHWGADLLKTNKDAYDRRVFEKAYQRFVRRPDPNATAEQKIEAIKNSLSNTKLDRYVTDHTLPNLTNRKVAAVWQKMAAPIQLPSSVGEEDYGADPTPESIMPQAPSGTAALNKEDLITIAMFLNKAFEAGIPLQESLAALSDDIKSVIHSEMPGLNPELATQLYGYDDKTAYDKKLVDRAAHEAATSPKNKLANPTAAQLAAGNYQKGHIWLHGLNISIENPKGSIRSGTSKAGKKWKVKLLNHYGYVRGAKGADGDHVDVFVGPNPDSHIVFAVNQNKPDGSFDEVKILMGFANKQEAKEAYFANYSAGWKGFGNIVAVTIEEFKAWLDSDQTHKPYKTPKSWKAASTKSLAAAGR